MKRRGHRRGKKKRPDPYTTPMPGVDQNRPYDYKAPLMRAATKPRGRASERSM